MLKLENLPETPKQPVIFLLEQSSQLGQFLLEQPEQFLTAEQQQKKNQLAEKPANEFKISRLLLKLLFDSWFHQWQLQYNPQGKPSLKGSQISFNLSHSQQLIGLMINPCGDCGLDLEWHNPQLNPLEVANTVFTTEECDRLQQHREPSKLFYDLWVSKEARLKHTGSGFSQDPKSLAFDLQQHHFCDQYNKDSNPIWLYRNFQTSSEDFFHMAACGQQISQPAEIIKLDLNLQQQLDCQPLNLYATEIANLNNI